MDFTTWTNLDIVVLLVLAVVSPLVGRRVFGELFRRDAAGAPDARMRAYKRILALEWTMSPALAIWWFAAGRSAASARLLPRAEGWQWLAIGLGLIAAGALILQMRSTLRNPDELRKMRDGLGELAAIAPRTPGEARLFDGVSLTAGIWEEVLYRGFLMTVLATAFGVWPAVLLSSLVFGLGHAYQGWGGILKTGGVGLGMALLTVASGSVFAAIVVHVVMDMTSGRMLRGVVDVPAEADAPQPGASGSDTASNFDGTDTKEETT